MQSQRKRWNRWRLGESSLKLLETTGPRLLSWSSPNGAVGFEKSAGQEARSLSNQSRQSDDITLRGSIELWLGGSRGILSSALPLLLFDAHLLWEEGHANAANLYTSNEVLLSNDYLTACTAVHNSPRAYVSKCGPTSISACSLYQSLCDCYDSQGQWENSSGVGTPAQMSRAVTPETSRPLRLKPSLLLYIRLHLLTVNDLWPLRLLL